MTSKLLAAALMCAVMASAAWSAPVTTDKEKVERDVLVVTGAGEAKGAPDVAYVVLGVTTQGKNAREAAQANAVQSQKLMAALKAQNLADKDIQTSEYSVQPRYENQAGRNPVIVGYDVVNQVRVTVRKLAAVGDVVDAALGAGANNAGGISFGIDQRAGQEDAALTAAVAVARRKADALARAAGVKITGVVQIQEGVAQTPRPMMFSRAAMADAAVTPISPGELTITANVTIVYSIAPSP